jgi:hypothetical protein
VTRHETIISGVVFSAAIQIPHFAGSSSTMMIVHLRNVSGSVRNGAMPLDLEFQI